MRPSLSFNLKMSLGEHRQDACAPSARLDGPPQTAAATREKSRPFVPQVNVEAGCTKWQAEKGLLERHWNKQRSTFAKKRGIHRAARGVRA